MKKIKKYFGGNAISSGLGTMSFNRQLPDVTLKLPTFQPRTYTDYLMEQFPLKKSLGNPQNDSSTTTTNTTTKTGNQLAASSINAIGGYLSDFAADKMFGDSEVGQNVGSVFGSALGSMTNTMSGNLIQGNTLMTGLGKNLGASLGGTVSGIAGNYLGKGISAAFGDSAVGRGLGAGIGTAVGGIGGMGFQALSKGKGFFDAFKVIKNAKAAAETAKTIGKAGDAIKAASAASKASSFASLGGLVGSAVGAGLQAGFGPSKEYNGRYGKGVQIADTAYDAAQAVVGFMGPVGALVSGFMALNKGLSNVFGSTDGMTLQDSILGSAWMPAPVKWLNMAGAKTTSTFGNQSWQNTERTNSFMGNAFGDINDRLNTAREEAGKTYGTFSRKAYNEAQNNLKFANSAWNQILAMTDQNELQNIRSQAMSSINNQRYAQDIQGGWSPLARGKYGMKILNNATNHNIGMRLLSGAALIDSKQMILCGAVD